MKHEFHAQYSLVARPGFAQQDGVDYLSGMVEQPPETWRDLEDVIDPSARIQLLAQAILTPYKSYARVGSRGKQAGLLHAIASTGLDGFFKQQSSAFLEPLNLDPTIPDIALFPRGAWAISFKFRLQKPYISKDDTDLYVIDNPVRKEWVFKVPYVAPTQWKGGLRSAMSRRLAEEADSLSDAAFASRRFRLALMFGDEKGEELGGVKGLAEYLDTARPTAAGTYREKVRKYFFSPLNDKEPSPSHAGRLRFYPTFFTRIGLEVINPHDRVRNTGINPIYLESVPTGTEGSFTLLYVPVDLVGRYEARFRTNVAEDLEMVAVGLQDMFTLFGFGAKTSSGCGVAEESLCGQGDLWLKASDAVESGRPKTLTEPVEPEIVRSFRQAYPGEQFSEKPKSWRKTHAASSANQNRYREVREAYRQYQQAVSTYRAALAEQESVAAQPVKAVTRRTFSSFAQLVERVAALNKG